MQSLIVSISALAPVLLAAAGTVPGRWFVANKDRVEKETVSMLHKFADGAQGKIESIVLDLNERNQENKEKPEPFPFLEVLRAPWAQQCVSGKLDKSTNQVCTTSQSQFPWGTDKICVPLELGLEPTEAQTMTLCVKLCNIFPQPRAMACTFVFDPNGSPNERTPTDHAHHCTPCYPDLPEFSEEVRRPIMERLHALRKDQGPRKKQDFDFEKVNEMLSEIDSKNPDANIQQDDDCPPATCVRAAKRNPAAGENENQLLEDLGIELPVHPNKPAAKRPRDGSQAPPNFTQINIDELQRDAPAGHAVRPAKDEF